MHFRQTSFVHRALARTSISHTNACSTLSTLINQLVEKLITSGWEVKDRKRKQKTISLTGCFVFLCSVVRLINTACCCTDNVLISPSPSNVYVQKVLGGNKQSCAIRSPIFYYQPPCLSLLVPK